MELLSILLVYLVTVAFLVWVCVLSDPNSNSLGGKLNILLTEELPGLLTSKLQRRLPPRLYDGLAHSYDWVVNRRNPLLQLLYLFLFLGSFAVYVYEGWGRMAPQDIAFSLALVVLCLSSFTVACFVRAGTITAGSWWRFDNYAPDGIIYEAGKECSTCKVPKLARSKHCRLCGVCQSRFDHHWYVFILLGGRRETRRVDRCILTHLTHGPSTHFLQHPTPKPTHTAGG